MMNENRWSALIESHEIAYLRGDLATSSPESYSIEEMKTICEGMEASTAEVEAAIRTDFTAMPPELQARMLELLEMADPGSMEFWNAILGLDMPDRMLDKI